MHKYFAFLVIVSLCSVSFADDSPLLKKYKKQFCSQSYWPGEMNPKCKSAESFCDLRAAIDKEAADCPKKTEGNSVLDYMAVKTCSARWDRVRKKMDRFVKKYKWKKTDPADLMTEQQCHAKAEKQAQTQPQPQQVPADDSSADQPAEE